MLRNANIHWQVGVAGSNTAVSFVCVQTAVESPMSSYPESQVYVAVTPIELPLNVTCPLSGWEGLAHKAAV